MGAPKVSLGQVASSLASLTDLVRQIAERRGFYRGVTPGEKIAIATRKLGNAMGHVKKGKRLTEVGADKTGKPNGFGIDLAKALITICDIASQTGVDLGAAVVTELQYSARRASNGR